MLEKAIGDALAKFAYAEPGPRPIEGVPRPMPTPSSTPVRMQPTRFFGSAEIDAIRPVKAIGAILNAVVMELQRTHGAKVKLTLEIEAEAPEGFCDTDVGVVRDNARQLKFKPDSTGFE